MQGCCATESRMTAELDVWRSRPEPGPDFIANPNPLTLTLTLIGSHARGRAARRA